MSNNIYEAPKNNIEGEISPKKKGKALKAFGLYLTIVLSGLLTSAIVGGYIIQDIWSNAKSILTAGQMTNSFSTESMVRTAMDDIKMLKENQLIEMFERKCITIAAFSGYIDPEIYNEHPERKMELVELLAESKKILDEMVKSGVCKEKDITNYSS